MELHKLTARHGADPKAAVRVITDTNVAAPALRWLAGEGAPSDDVVAAFSWMQSRALSSLVSRRDVRLDLQWAALETSRRHGRVDGDRLTEMHAANVRLLDWLFGVVPIARRFAEEPARLRPIRAIAKQNRDTSDNAAVNGESVCLVLLSQLHRRRQAGELRGVRQRLAALEEWVEQISPLQALSADLLLIAVQTALAGDGAPARAMCKFGNYRDRRSARSTAANAAWDLQFLRLMRASEAGLGPYSDHHGPTVLLTFDRQLAAAAADLTYTARADGAPSGSTVVTLMGNRTHLQNDVLRDSKMLGELDEWCGSLVRLQASRWNMKRTLNAAAIESMLESVLEATFPDERA